MGRGFVGGLLLSRAEDAADRAGKHRRQEDQVADQRGDQKGQHQRAESLGGRKGAEGEHGQSQPADQRRLRHCRGATFVRPKHGPLAVAPPVQAVAEPGQVVDRIVDGHAQRHAGGHHRADVDQDPQPAHDAENDHYGKDIGDHRQQAGRRAAQHQHHHHRDQHEGQLEAVEQAGHQLVLGLVDQRDQAGVSDLDSFDRFEALSAIALREFHFSVLLVEHLFDFFLDFVDEDAVVQIGQCPDPHAYAPQFLAVVGPPPVDGPGDPGGLLGADPADGGQDLLDRFGAAKFLDRQQGLELSGFERLGQLAGDAEFFERRVVVGRPPCLDRFGHFGGLPGIDTLDGLQVPVLPDRVEREQVFGLEQCGNSFGQFEIVQAGVGVFVGYRLLFVDAQVVAQGFAALVQLAAEGGVLDAVSESLFRRLGGLCHRRCERGRRQGAAYIFRELLLDGLLDVADHPHPLDHVQLALLVVHADHHFHRHQRPELLLQPRVVGNDLGLGGEELHQLDRGIDPRSAEDEEDHHRQADGRDPAVAPHDKAADDAPEPTEGRIDFHFRRLPIRVADELPGGKIVQHDRQEQEQPTQGGQYTQRRVQPEVPYRDQLAGHQGSQPQCGGHRGDGARFPAVPECPAGRAGETVLADRVVVVVDDVHRPGDRQDVDQRGHRQQHRVDHAAGVIDQRHADPGRKQRADEDEQRQPDAAEAAPGDSQPDHQRQPRQAKQGAFPLVVDGRVVDRRSTQTKFILGYGALLGRDMADSIQDGAEFSAVEGVAQRDHQTGLVVVLSDQRAFQPLEHLFFGEVLISQLEFIHQPAAGKHGLLEGRYPRLELLGHFGGLPPVNALDRCQFAVIFDRPPSKQTLGLQRLGKPAGNAQILEVGVEVFQLPGEQFQPATRIAQRAPFPACQHELLVGKVLLEPAVVGRLLKPLGQPLPDVVLVAQKRPTCAGPNQGQQKYHHQDDKETSSGEEWLLHYATGLRL